MMREVADLGIDRREYRVPRIDRAFADRPLARPAGAGRRRAARPLIEQAAVEIAAAQHRREQARRVQRRRRRRRRPGHCPPAPLPVPVPTPPAPVPGPRTSDAPWVGAAPWRGVSLTRDLRHRRSTIFGLGATTGVASLLMFLGDEPPSFSLGLAPLPAWRRRRRWRRRLECVDVEHPQHALRIGRSIWPDMCRKREQQPGVDRDHRRDRAALVPGVEVRPVHPPSQRDGAGAVAERAVCGTPEGKRGSATLSAASGVPPLGGGQQSAANAGLRPPPWLDLPPLLAISRCLAGSIAANPRFAPLVLVIGIYQLPIVPTPPFAANASNSQWVH